MEIAFPFKGYVFRSLKIEKILYKVSVGVPLLIRESPGGITAHPCQAIYFVGGVAARPHRCRGASHRLIGLCNLDSAEILCPIGAARFGQGARFGVGRISAKHNRTIRLLAVAPTT